MTEDSERTTEHEQTENCPVCGHRFTPTPAGYWCDLCEMEYWTEADTWYRCDESGDPELVTDSTGDKLIADGGIDSETESQIRDRFRTDHAFMCVNCSVMRWGFPHDECPACGEKGVHRLNFEKADEDDEVEA